MTQELDTLSELIDRHLPARGMNREQLAKTIGVSPSTLSRWSTRMPGPETIHALAVALDQPYAVVLAAALRSGGYADTTADILSGHTITLVARDPACTEADENDEQPGAVFTDPDRAQKWAHVRGELDARLGAYGHGSTATGSVVIDGALAPEHVVVYRANWEHRTDTVTVSESGVFAEVPSGLDPLTARVESLTDTGKVYAVSASGLDAGIATGVVADAVSHLREAGQLLGTEESTGLHWSDHLVHDELQRMRDYARERGEAISGEESARLEPLARARIEALTSEFKPFDRAQLAKVANAQPIPYVWGGGAGSPDAGRETKAWSDPISSYCLHPLDGEES